MTYFLRDILRQPKELQRTIDFLLGTGGLALEAAKNAILSARHVYLTGIGSSWHAALTAGPLFHDGSRPVYMLEAAELLEFAMIPADSTVVIISRSGRSIEIVNLLAKVRGRGVTVIGITNSEDGQLAREGQNFHRGSRRVGSCNFGEHLFHAGTHCRNSRQCGGRFLRREPRKVAITCHRKN